MIIIRHKYHSRYFKITSNFTRLTTREIMYNCKISLQIMLAITYTNYEYITCNSNKTKCFMSFCQLSCLKISTENLFVNLGDVERRKFLCFIISLGPTSLVDKRTNNRASVIKESNKAED